MCGICGIVGQPDEQLIKKMLARIAHRGPDDEGVYIAETSGGARIGLGHRRLSIIDLSEAGAQPMASASGRFVLTFNGEIYNHGALRRELLASVPDLAFRGHSDTEVFLAACEAWGVERALQRANGMFAMGMVDRQARALHLVRDRLGEKPLYFGEAGGVLLFGSELKALRAQGMELVMLTGDNRTTAEAVGRSLGITKVEAEVLPEDKSRIVETLKREGRIVAMAGDGVNDAPALAAADVGIAMGTGTDVAIESAGVTLLKGDLSGIVKGRAVSKATMANIRQNLIFAFGYNVAGIPIAAGVLYPFTGQLLSPMIAAAAMALSSVSVIANSLRLGAARS